jgi:hypothetical protein
MKRLKIFGGVGNIYLIGFIIGVFGKENDKKMANLI